MDKQCTELEEIEEKHDCHHLYINIRTMTNIKIFSDSGNSIMVKADENIYYEKRKIKDRWFDYVN